MLVLGGSGGYGLAEGCGSGMGRRGRVLRGWVEVGCSVAGGIECDEMWWGRLGCVGLGAIGEGTCGSGVDLMLLRLRFLELEVGR